MDLRNIFKKKKQEPKKGAKQEAKPATSRPTEPQPEKPRKEKSKARVFGVLERAHITEKASIQSENGKYIFNVSPAATKPEIKKAVEGFYNVNVEKVNVINIPRKKKQLMRTRGFKQGYRKAIVSLQKGQSIELLPR